MLRDTKYIVTKVFLIFFVKRHIKVLYLLSNYSTLNMNKNYLKIIFTLFLFLSTSSLFGTEYFFFVQFTDKNNTPFTLDKPSEFLSERALERRRYFRLECDSTDLPINPEYVKNIELKGFATHNVTKWFNGITISTQDSVSVDILKDFHFVKQIEYTGKRTDRRKTVKKSAATFRDFLTDSGQYGFANEQIEQIKGKYLHSLGFRGNDVHIAVLDAGFQEVDITRAYNSLFLQNRLLGTKDFVEENSDIYQKHYHGAYVLSTMAAYIPDTFIGMAPEASYWLIRTEDTNSEYPMEMDFWVSGAEYADSIGADVINSSLGYTVFDNPMLNLSYEDLDGKTTRISRAATLASEKGIIVVNSAGNEGDKSWKKIGAPADAEGIITVGGVNASGTPSNFSSHGFSYDGRIKPEIVARATETAIMINDDATERSGTSFASPIIAGMMACFLQAVKESFDYMSLEDILNIVFESANLYHKPNERMGYGIPNFEEAAKFLLSPSKETIYTPEYINIYTDTMSKTLNILLSSQYDYKKVTIQLYSITGELMTQLNFATTHLQINTSQYPSGIYALRLVTPDGNSINRKVLIY